MGNKLNIDVAGSISELESFMKQFMLKKTIYKIIFRGKGLEFDSYRDFGPDDDSSMIDWKASLRANKMLAKQYVEEKDLKIVFLVDTGEGMVFGSTKRLKCEYAAETAAALAHLLLESGDKLGFVLFGEKVKKIVLPEGGMKQLGIFVSELEDADNYGGKSDVKSAMEEMMRYLDNSISAVVVISDFLNVNREIEKTVQNFSDRFETMFIMIKDPLDMTLPEKSQEVLVEDYQSGKVKIIDPAIARKTYEKYALEQENIVRKIFTLSGADFLKLDTSKSFAFFLAEFLKERVEVRGGIAARR